MTQTHLIRIDVKAEAIVEAATPEEAIEKAKAAYMPPLDHETVGFEAEDTLGTKKEIEIAIRMGARKLEDL